MQFDFITMQALYLVAGAARTPGRWPRRSAARPAIRTTCQWATFVRNHDELTLDKLTDAERQEVFAAFGPEPAMQVYGRGLQAPAPAHARRRPAPHPDGLQPAVLAARHARCCSTARRSGWARTSTPRAGWPCARRCSGRRGRTAASRRAAPGRLIQRPVRVASGPSTSTSATSGATPTRCGLHAAAHPDLPRVSRARVGRVRRAEAARPPGARARLHLARELGRCRSQPLRRTAGGRDLATRPTGQPWCSRTSTPATTRSSPGAAWLASSWTPTDTGGGVCAPPPSRSSWRSSAGERPRPFFSPPQRLDPELGRGGEGGLGAGPRHRVGTRTYGDAHRRGQVVARAERGRHRPDERVAGTRRVHHLHLRGGDDLHAIGVGHHGALPADGDDDGAHSRSRSPRRPARRPPLVPRRPSRPLASDSLTTRGSHSASTASSTGRYGARLTTARQPTSAAVRIAASKAATGISACVTRTPEAARRRRTASSTDAGSSRALAPGATTIEFSPCASTKTNASPVRASVGNHLGGVDPGLGERGGERVPVGVVAHPGDQGGARPEQARRDRLVAALAAGAHRRLASEDGLARRRQCLDPADVVAVDRPDHQHVDPAVCGAFSGHGISIVGPRGLRPDRRAAQHRRGDPLVRRARAPPARGGGRAHRRRSAPSSSPRSGPRRSRPGCTPPTCPRRSAGPGSTR